MRALLCVAVAIGLSTLARAAQPVEHCDSLLITQVRSALSDLRASWSLHCGSGETPVTLVYEGTAAFEDHLMRPGMLRTVPARIEFSLDPKAGSLALREHAGRAGAGSTTTTLVHDGRIAVRDGSAASFTEEPAATNAAWASWLPQTSVHAALAAAASCRPGAVIHPRAADGTAARALSPITFSDAAGTSRTLLLDGEHRVVRIEQITSHQRLGDVCEWTDFSAYTSDSGMAVPGRISRFIVHGSATSRFDLTLVSASVLPAGTPVAALPADHAGDIPGWGLDARSRGFEFVRLAPSLWSVEIEAANARVLVIERDSDLVVLGAPDGDAVCQGLVDALSDRFPGHPIGLAAFGHHHPSPSGGLRALARAGATIVTPRQLEPYVRELLSRPTTLGPPAVTAPDDARLQLFDGEFTIPCGEATVRLIDIAESSAHAFCYTVFYFPDSGILFEDDLGYFPLNRAATAGPRLRGLVRALDERGVAPTRLIQLWPVRGVVREVEWSAVTELTRVKSGTSP